jgi:hypothetical protein
MQRIVLLSCIMAITIGCSQAPSPISLDQWTYIQVDNNRGKWGDFAPKKSIKYFGLAARDITGDGYGDLVAGRYFYRNPGGDMAAPWPRIDLGLNVDGVLFVDVDGDEFGDIIGIALPDVYWLEAADTEGSAWKAHIIAKIPKTKHINSQGHQTAQIISGGKEEILLSSGGGVHCLSIPAQPENGNWPAIAIAPESSEEGIGIQDIDGDGDLDISAGYGSKQEGSKLAWWENPGQLAAGWAMHPVGEVEAYVDRVKIADMNGDGRADIIVSEERWPGKEPNASCFWFEQGVSPQADWTRHTVITEYSLNNLDVADMDRDGDMDIVTCEHKGPSEKLQIFENDGAGNYTEHLLDQGKESHLGAETADLDGDGDREIFSVAWDEHKFLHLWRNDAIKK